MQDMLCRHNCSEVGLSELLMALESLKPESNSTHAIIAETLGLSWSGVERRTIADSELESPHLPSLNSIGEDVTSELNVPVQLSDPEIRLDSQSKFIEPIGREDKIFEALFDNPILASIEALEPTNVALHMKKPMYQPLLQERWFRGLISAMLSTSIVSQEIDWTVLERELARGRLLERLPFRQRPTLKRGVLLFLDRSESMQPFWRDEKELLSQLHRLLGQIKVKSWWLKVDHWLPDGPKLKWYSPSPHQLSENTPVLLVSDFGIGGDPTSSQINLEPWFPLLDLARICSCPLVALIPAPESYWPSILKQHIPYSFVWDHDTSIAAALRHWHRIR